MKKTILGIAGATAGLLLWLTPSTHAGWEFGISVGVAPPAPIVEPMVVAPTTGYVWVPGNYIWVNGGWVWVRGHWALPPRGYVAWIPGSWVSYSGHWYWRGGHWR